MIEKTANVVHLVEPQVTESRQRSRQPVADILALGQLTPVFQPIVELAGGKIFAHEALIRGPAGTPCEYPDHLFAAASLEGLTLDLEIACMQTIVRATAQSQVDGLVFVNMSAQALIRYADRLGPLALCQLAESEGVRASKLVIEITEHERVSDMSGLRCLADTWRARGFAFALDDFGDGRSSLRLWAELLPDFVKIDKYFTRDIATHPAKVQTFRALCQIAETFGSRLVAEGIEDADCLAVVRDLGVEFGQGYFFAHPKAVAVQRITPAALTAFASRDVAILGFRTRPTMRGLAMQQLMINVQPVTLETSCLEVLQLFQQREDLHALPVVIDHVPLGLINRRTFMERFTRPYQRELFGPRSCKNFMDPHPRMIERSADGEQIMAILTSDDQRYLTEGFIITDAGRYAGIGSGEQLVRAASERRVEAARHANPLTFLPGNVPITDHIERLLRSRQTFWASYFDLRHFKPFNDIYGYWRGDEMIRLLASIVMAHTDRRRDFVGHVGGDDFVVLFQNNDWRVRCETMITVFNERARTLYDADAVIRGGIESEDRNGLAAFFPLTTLCVGAVQIRPGQFRLPEQVASAAAGAKRLAKHEARGTFVEGETGHSTEAESLWVFEGPPDV